MVVTDQEAIEEFHNKEVHVADELFKDGETEAGTYSFCTIQFYGNSKLVRLMSVKKNVSGNYSTLSGVDFLRGFKVPELTHAE